MKISILSTLLISAALAQDQVPLKEKAAAWLDKAKSYIPSGTPSIPDPVQAAANAFAGKKVTKVNIRNYQRLFRPKVGGEEEWMVYLTGGNKTCFGLCGKADAAWNESVPILSALPQPAGAPTLHLGQIDCEKEQVLCNLMSVAPPSLLHFNFPQLPYENASPQPASEFRYAGFNRTTVTPKHIIDLAANAPDSKLYEIPVYEGWLHPVDSQLARLGIQSWLGYVVWGMSTMPSWLVMIVLSFFSRQIMGRKMAGKPPPDIYGKAAPRPAGGAQAAPAPVPAAAGKGTPGSAGKGGKKKR